MVAETTIEAEISVRKDGSIYVGVKAREMLGVGYNDEITITFREKGPSGSDITISGMLDSGNSIYVGKDLTHTIRSDNSEGVLSTPEHINAIVAKGNKNWYDENSGESEPNRRWQKASHLSAEVLPTK
jgi:hypothetical protein